MGLALVGASLEGRGVGVLWAPTAVGQRGAQTRTALSARFSSGPGFFVIFFSKSMQEDAARPLGVPWVNAEVFGPCLSIV